MYMNLIKSIPKEYESKKSQIHDDMIKRIYTLTSFNYLQIPNTNFDQENIDDYNDQNISILFSSIMRKFSAIEIRKSNKCLNKNEQSKSDSNFSSEIVNVIICNESGCTIIENIKFELIQNILNKEQEKASIIDVSRDFTNREKTREEEHAIEEIENFRSKFLKEIKNNEFVDYTISPIISYMIRRFFYPRKYFNDQSFFDYRPDFCQHYFDNILKYRLNKDKLYMSVCVFVNEIKHYNKQQRIIEDFKENDFILLRELCCKEDSSFNLVIHIKSFHIFMMKKIFNPDNKTREIDHEIDFCSKYSNRCLTPFYGFVKQNKKIIGFI